MKTTEFRKLIREEVKKALNENYRDPDENLDVLIKLLKKTLKCNFLIGQNIQ